MKKLILILIGLALIYFTGCRLDTTELAAKLKPDIEKTIQTNFNKNFVAVKLAIIHSDGNNYEGLMEGEKNDNFIFYVRTYHVKITYDGENAYYEVKPVFAK